MIVVHEERGRCIVATEPILQERDIHARRALLEIQGLEWAFPVPVVQEKRIDCIVSWTGQSAMSLVFPGRCLIVTVKLF